MAGKFAGWYRGVRFPEFYLSNTSGFLHRVKHVETLVEKGVPVRASVTFMCGGLGSVSRDSVKSKGKWATKEEPHTTCVKCEEASKNRTKGKSRPAFSSNQIIKEGVV